MRNEAQEDFVEMANLEYFPYNTCKNVTEFGVMASKELCSRFAAASSLSFQALCVSKSQTKHAVFHNCTCTFLRAMGSCARANIRNDSEIVL